MPAQIQDPWSSPTTYPSSPLYATAGGASSTPSDGGISFQERLLNKYRQGKEKTKETLEQARTKLGGLDTPENRNRMRTAGGIGATALGVIPGAIGTAQQQGIIPGIASAGAGLGAAALTAPISNAMMKSGNIGLKLAGFGLQALAPAAAQAGVSGMFSAGETGKQGAGGTDVSIPGTPVTPEVPLSDAARERMQRDRDLAYEQKRTQVLGQAQLGLDKQALMDQNNALVMLQKSLLPIQERTMRNQLVNQQALMNTQSAAYQQLGRQAGMFKLAGQGMAEAGATLRTAISQNPYAGSTIQAPSINFG